MAYTHKPGTGSMFQNTKTTDTQPDFKGELLTTDGQLIRFAGWERTTSNGTSCSTN